MKDAPIRAPVANVELEQGLLGALLLNNNVLDNCRRLEPHHFYDPVHARIFDLARKRIDMGLLASAVTMRSMMTMDPGLTDLGGADYLARMAGAAVSIAAAGDYATEIVDLYARRTIIASADEMVEQLAFAQGATAPSSVDEALDTTEATLSRLRAEVAPTPLVTTFRAAMEQATDRANRAYHRQGEAEVSTGIPRLDKITGGVMPGHFTLIGARTSMGKTALAVEIAANVIAQGRAVHFITLEMTEAQLSDRFISRAMAVAGTRIEYARIGAGRMAEHEFRAYLEACRDAEGLPLTMADPVVEQIGRIRASIRTAKRRWENTATPLSAVIVDYLQMIKVPGTRSKIEEVTEAARSMQRLAKEFDLGVYTMAQVSRAVEDRKNKRPQLNDIKWASEAEDAADVVLFLYRHAYYLDAEIKGMDEGADRSRAIADLENCRHAAEVIVAKNRHGAIGTAGVWCDLGVNRFSNAPIMSADTPAQEQLGEFR